MPIYNTSVSILIRRNVCKSVPQSSAWGSTFPICARFSAHTLAYVWWCVCDTKRAWSHPKLASSRPRIASDHMLVKHTQISKREQPQLDSTAAARLVLHTVCHIAKDIYWFFPFPLRSNDTLCGRLGVAVPHSSMSSKWEGEWQKHQDARILATQIRGGWFFACLSCWALESCVVESGFWLGIIFDSFCFSCLMVRESFSLLGL